MKKRKGCGARLMGCSGLELPLTQLQNHGLGAVWVQQRSAGEAG